MTTIARIRTDYDVRLHVEQDVDAQVLDCFTVQLPPYTFGPGLLVYREGVDINALWADALAMVAHLRAQPWKEVHPPHVFQPFGIITARSLDDVRREHEVRREMMGGQLASPADIARVANISEAEARNRHERGVASLCRAHDLLRGAPLAVPVPWPKLKALMN